MMAARIYLVIIVLGVLGGVGWFGYQYYVSTQNAIRTLTANNATLKTAHDTTLAEFQQYQNKVAKEIEEFKAELVRQQQLNDDLSTNLKKVQDRRLFFVYTVVDIPMGSELLLKYEWYKL